MLRTFRKTMVGKLLRAVNIVVARRRQADERWQRTDPVGYHVYHSKLLTD